MVVQPDGTTAPPVQPVAVAVLRWGVVALVLAAAAAVLGAGSWRVFVALGPNFCAMTYMQPRYLPVPVPASPHAAKYALSLYRERDQPPVLEGQPVLFIPGNAGSASQVRSLGAEAYRLVAHQGGRRGKVDGGGGGGGVVDLFAAHFDEELSAFDGGLLADQVEHVVHCIDAILQAYREGSFSGGRSSRPTSVVLVGHSMGGFVARALFVHPAFRPASVDTVITLNTPHRLMPLLLHRSVADLYHKVNGFWRQQFNTSHFRLVSQVAGEAALPTTPSLANVTVLSIAGSFRDSLVRSDLASLETLVPTSHGLSLLTTSIPGVRLEADHQSIMWCNQLVKAVAGALIELANLQAPAGSVVPVDARMRLFGRRFLSPLPSRLGFTLPHERWYSPPELAHGDIAATGLKLREDLAPEDMHSKPWLRLTADSNDGPLPPHYFNVSQWHVVRLREQDLDSFVLIAPQSAEKNLRVMLYPASETEAVVSAANLSFVARQYGDDDIFTRGKARWIESSSPPATQDGLSLLYLSPELLRNYAYVAVESKSDAFRSVFGQFVRQGAIVMRLPYYGFSTKTDLPRGHAALVNVTLPGVDHRIPLLLTLTATNNDSSDWTPVMFGLMPHMGEEIMVTSKLSQVSIKFHGAMEAQPLHLVFFIDPACGYQLEVEYDYVGIMEQMLKYHLISGIPAYFFVFLLVLAALSRRYASGGSMGVAGVWRDHTFRMSCLLFVALPLFETIWVVATADVHFQRLYSLVGQAFARLPGPLSEHSFVDFDVSPPPLSLYPFIYAFGSLLFFIYLALVRLALAIITVFFRILLWLGAVLLCRRRATQPRPSPSARDTGRESSDGRGQSVASGEERTEAQRRRLDALGVVYLMLLAISAGLTLALHSFVGMLITTLVLGFSTAWQTARAKSSGTPLSRAQAYERDTLFSYRTVILVACLATLSAMAPLFVSWVKSLPSAPVWRASDGYELLCLVLIVISAFASHPFQHGKAGSLLWLVAYGAAGVVVCYCLVPLYRLQDVAALVYSLLVFFHLQKQQERR